MEFGKERFKEIKYIFSNIVSSVRENKALFFLGAGFSMNFKIVSWERFVESVINDILDDISIHEGEWIKKREDANIESNLVLIKNAISSGTINLEFALEQIYRIIGIDVFKTGNENGYALDVIREIYKKHFFVDREKVGMLKIDEKKLIDIASLFKKVITTNYDNLLPYIWSEFWQVDKIPYKFIDINNFNYIDEEKFYIQFHGGILNENFVEKNIWETNGEGGKIQFPIIDSFSTFQKAYSLYDSNIRDFLSNIFGEAFEEKGKLILFGYSFRDQFLSKEIMDIISKMDFNNTNEDLIYIVLDDLDNFILKKIDAMAPYNTNDILKPIKEQVGVKYVYYSDLILSRGEYQSYSDVIEKSTNKINELNELITNFKKDNNVSEKVLTTYVFEHKEFKAIKTMLYNDLMNDLLYCFDSQSEVLEQTLSVSDISEMFSEQFKRTLLYKMSGYDANEIYKIYLDNKTDDDFSIYCYSLIHIFNLEFNEHYNIFKSFFEFYKGQFQKSADYIKLPELLTKIYGNGDDGTEIDKLLLSLGINPLELWEW
jgi:sulfur transfer complex TusBCD TusB component (DsrH family)